MDQAVNATRLPLPDRRVCTRAPLQKDRTTVISDSTNVDASGPRTTMLRPATILLYDAATGRFFDDATSGDASAPAVASSLIAGSAACDNATITLFIDGVSIVTVTLGGADDTTSEIVTALNANAVFAAHAIAAGADGAVLTITLRDPERAIKVTSSATTFFPAAGVLANPTEADVVVTLDYCDQLDALGNVANARVEATRAGTFDESNLLWQGAAATSAAAYQDFKRILMKRGSRFE